MSGLNKEKRYRLIIISLTQKNAYEFQPILTQIYHNERTNQNNLTGLHISNINLIFGLAYLPFNI